MDDTETELDYTTPFELLIAVMLSAQCTDKRINQVTPALFAAYPTPETLAAATPEEVFQYIRSVSYPNNKAKHLVGMAKVVMVVMRKTCGGIHKQKTPHVGALVAKTLHMNVPATRRCHTAVVVAVGDAHVLPPTVVKPWGHGVMPIAPMVAMVHRAVPANQTPVTLKYIK
jgi:hypothetical protein